MVEPERMITFRVTWVDDNGNVQVNRGYRVHLTLLLDHTKVVFVYILPYALL